MDKILLTKIVKDVSVGHLYEHIFVDYVTDALRAAGLFAYVDYHIDAKTYHSGVVTIEFEPYTDEASEWVGKLVATRLRLDSNVINGALLQIMAELEQDVIFIDDDLVLERLSTLDSSEWKYGAMDSVGRALVTDAIIYGPSSEQELGTVVQTVLINRESVPDELLPLALIVMKAIRSNLQEDISRESYCFTYEDMFRLDDAHAQDVNRYRIDARQATAISDEPDVAARLLKLARSGDFARRLAKSIQNASPDAPEYPNADEIYAKTHIRIDTDTWKTLAREENIASILDSVFVSFAYE